MNGVPLERAWSFWFRVQCSFDAIWNHWYFRLRLAVRVFVSLQKQEAKASPADPITQAGEVCVNREVLVLRCSLTSRGSFLFQGAAIPKSRRLHSDSVGVRAILAWSKHLHIWNGKHREEGKTCLRSSYRWSRLFCDEITSQGPRCMSSELLRFNRHAGIKVHMVHTVCGVHW